MQLPFSEKLNLSLINHPVQNLQKTGILKISKNRLLYLDIDDNYVHLLFPLLDNIKANIKKPNYFGKGLAGAHISVIYPEEERVIRKEDLEREHPFQLKEMAMVIIGLKKYYVMMIDSPSLNQIRANYSLPATLNFKGYAVGFHITIGVST